MNLRIFLAALAGFPALAAFGAPEAPAAPLSERSVYQVGGAWTDDAGSPAPLAGLLGHPVVLAMIFTGCGSACPLTVHQMKDLENALPGALRRRTRFVLVSFDADGDTPAVLRAYRDRSGLGAATWVLLHGDAEHIRKLARVLGVTYSQVAPGVFAHSSEITILNPAGEIAYQRPTLEGATAEAVQTLAAAAR